MYKKKKNIKPTSLEKQLSKGVCTSFSKSSRTSLEDE